MTSSTEPSPPSGPVLRVSDGFAAWLAETGCSLALTTYHRGRLVFIGRRPDGALRAHERLIEQCQGLWTDGQTLWVSGDHMLWRFENDLPEGARTATGADRRFAPREARVTGQIDIHDIAMGDTGQFGGPAGQAPIFVNTAFNCLATIDDTASFRPLWRPPFIGGIVGEDRCHLNGLAMQGDRVAYATAVAETDTADAWRGQRADGGVVIDVAADRIVARGLSMPHSPRLHDGRLWVLNTGRGELCTVDPEPGAATPVAPCPGYARGLAFTGRYAVVGLSRPRNNATFDGLELDDRLAAAGTAPQCGLLIVDIDTGRTAAWLSFEHTIDELYDVAVLPGVTQPEAIGFLGDEIKHAVTVADG